MMRAFRVGDAEGGCSEAGEGVTDFSGKDEREGDSSGIAEEVGVGNSCAAANTVIAIHDAIIRNPRFAVRTSRIITPVHVWEKVIAAFTFAQEFLIDMICNELIT